MTAAHVGLVVLLVFAVAGLYLLVFRVIGDRWVRTGNPWLVALAVLLFALFIWAEWVQL